MREYFVTYKDADGVLQERRIAGRNHTVATRPLQDAGCEIVDDEDADTGRRVGSSAKSAAIAILLALMVAVLILAVFWWRRG